MRSFFSHRRGRAVTSVTALATLALVGALGVAPSAADELSAVESFDVEPDQDFPVDALNGERNARASDALLLTDPETGLSFWRAANAEGTDLVGDARGDSAVPALHGRDRINPAAVTGAGTITAPFAERSLSLSHVTSGEPSLGLAPDRILQLTSPSDDAEAQDGYTTLGDLVDRPEPGKTYLLRSSIVLPGVDQAATAAVTATAMRDFYAHQMARVQGHPSTTQQWLIVAQGTSDDGTPRFQMVNRNDGTCFTQVVIGPLPGDNGEIVGQVCNEADERQLWEARDLPAGGDFGVGLRNVSSDEWMAYYDTWGNTPAHLWTWGERNMFDHGQSGYALKWQEVQQPTRVPASAAFHGENRSDFPFDLAVGDVDTVAGTEGVARDESVVAHAFNGALRVSVVNYSANDSGLLVTTKATSASIGQAASGGDYAPVAVDVADLDGDGIGEIVVTYVDENGAVNALVARYAALDDGTASLDVIGEPQPLGFSMPTDAAFSADAVIDDFDGDGVQEIAWVGADAGQGDVPTLWTVAAQLVDGAFSVTPETSAALSSSAKPLEDGLGWHARVRVESGQFQQAQEGSGVRQIAVTWEDADGAYVDAFAVAAGADAAESIFPEPIATPQVVGSKSVSLAVGGFANAGGGEGVEWAIAVSAIGGPTTDNTVTLVQPIDPDRAPAVSTISVSPDNGETMDRTGFELSAWDRKGESLVLGEPVVFTVQELVGMNLVGGQPPGHSDWLDGGFVNVSRNQGFSLTMGSSSSVAYENGTSQESNQSYGLTTESSISSTVKAGVPFLTKAEISAEVSAALEGSWSSLGKAVTSSNSSQTLSLTQSTQDDDIVNAMVQDHRVYRYPVLSVDTWNRTDAAESGCESGCYGYWDVVVPGEPHPAQGSGKSYGFFQPTWQNGNALSYPQLVDGEVPLGEIGSYSYVDANGDTQTVTEPLVNQQFGISSVVTDQTLDLTDASSHGSTETSSKGWTAGIDVAAGVAAGVKIPTIADLETELELKAGFNAAQSFVGSVTGKTSNTHDSTFLIHVPAVEGNRGYSFGAAYYYGTDGAPRVSYAVDLTADNQSREWWLTNYGEKPDPALNLPFSTILTYNSRGFLSVPLWNPLDNRQRIRGFTARMPYSDDPATSGAPYAQGPQAGDPVVFDVEVANYSLKPLIEPVTVDFYAVPVDANFLHVSGDPVPIGDATIASIGAQSRVTVSSPEWTAQGTSEGGGQNWRIFVVLDGDDSIDEVHEWAGTGQDLCPSETVQDEAELIDPMTDEPETLTCGQNNQGFGQISVLPNVDAAPAAAAAATDGGPANVELIGAGVLTGDPETLRLTAESAVPQVTTGHATTVLLRADAGRHSAPYQTVIVYDGPPADGNVVAVTRMLGVLDNGTSTTSFQYVPEEDGLTELHAVILGQTDTGASDGIIVRMNSNAPADSGGDDGSDGGGDSGDDGDQGGQDEAAGGDLAITGQDLMPWLLVGLGAALLVALGVFLRRIRSRTER